MLGRLRACEAESPSRSRIFLHPTFFLAAREGTITMNNADIDRYFAEAGLTDAIHRETHQPTDVWLFLASDTQVMIQTQESANRMRIVAFIAEAGDLERDHLYELLEANYHSALDARYAIAEGHLVAAFLHPFEELTPEQFVLGLYQVISCAETYGGSNSGGTLVFGDGQGEEDPAPMEEGLDEIASELLSRLEPGTVN